MIVAVLLGTAPPALAAPSRGPAPISELVIDAQTGRALYAANASIRRPPASLAKVMTLLLVFDALDMGQLKPGDRIVMTPAGARQPPSRLGLGIGRGMSVAAAMKAIAVISANDIAVAFADRIGGSEARFVTRMNARAAEIGMTNTRFGNATGLAPSGGVTTATDMAVLARYLIRHHPDRYRLFATRQIRWQGQSRPNHNKLLGKVKGLDGLKTGYTVPAGFNLAASARRGGKRMVVVVMGAQSAAARDLLVANLMESGFSSPQGSRPRAVVTHSARREGGAVPTRQDRMRKQLDRPRAAPQRDGRKKTSASRPAKPAKRAHERK
ncbi:D-alanyl-D-alanine carboxypeptidase/D-alanyl-D-alanine carboxypeptidase (penicillin-binding protein 5/6) [Sphingomonas gellani]|uniref:D-alanyl-D-alanine carboxypeptidase/D-alanyl-D-alanine carboxypeptidase (Penicillin-binding protein 5/6) n=1 Tax=Sphingomonas gellani TaxID=1166340 RepID=A0A1H8IAB9_9SPHN|nr:D-alanyl-D-alanine carboxypeptidase family protein [Sphingomonas gellani]SEN65364.1 D-alanyl-D-alanine carboxypeptidase/D-alanyl-D-alanine carboxypeptidase (penicillin-binding protein 5/6) [Sphingomonas gellani]